MGGWVTKTIGFVSVSAFAVAAKKPNSATAKKVPVIAFRFFMRCPGSSWIWAIPRRIKSVNSCQQIFLSQFVGAESTQLIKISSARNPLLRTDHLERSAQTNVIG